MRFKIIYNVCFYFSEHAALAVYPAFSAILSKDLGIKKCTLITLRKEAM